MANQQISHIFSQGGDLSQLTCGFPSEKDSSNQNNHIFSQVGDHSQLTDPGINREQDYNRPVQEGDIPCGQDETMTSRAESICEENRQINRFVESSLKQLEKKRIKLTNKEKSLDEEIAKLLEEKKRQSELIYELQMNIEECGNKYANELKQRKTVVEK